MKFFTLFSGVVAFMLLSSCEQEPALPFSTWDTDNDGVITHEEFMQKWEEVDYYADWDLNNNGVLEQEEWQTSFDEYYYDWDNDQLSVFTEWDKDGDGRLTQEELARGTFEHWDANADGVVTPREYEQRAGTQYR